jgi:DNA-binding beta-propeller fold protein YncE
MNPTKWFWFVLLCAACLAACGGGGSGAAASVREAPQAAGTDAIAQPSPQQQRLSLLAGEAGAVGNLDGPALDARFNQPRGVVADALGNLYVADTWNHAIRKIASDGAVSTIAGNSGAPGAADGTAAEARFCLPWGITRSRLGALYMADACGHTIRALTFDAQSGWTVRTVAGQAFSSGAAPHATYVPKLDTRFNWPRSVAVDAQGNVVVADSNNFVVQIVVAATGMAYTAAGRSNEPVPHRSSS